MSVAANLEVVGDMHWEPGPSQAPAAPPQNENFRSNWQTLLASMGTNPNALREDSASAFNGRLVQARQPGALPGQPSSEGSQLVEAEKETTARRTEAGSSAVRTAEDAYPSSHALKARKNARHAELQAVVGFDPRLNLPLPGVVAVAAPDAVAARPEMSTGGNHDENSRSGGLSEGTSIRPASSGLLQSVKSSAKSPGGEMSSGTEQASAEAGARNPGNRGSHGVETGGITSIDRSEAAPAGQVADQGANQLSMAGPQLSQSEDGSASWGRAATQRESTALNAGEKNSSAGEGTSSQTESFEPVPLQTNVAGPYPASFHGPAPTEHESWGPKLQAAAAPAAKPGVDALPENVPSAIQQGSDSLPAVPLVGRQAVIDGIRASGRAALPGTRTANSIHLVGGSSPDAIQSGNPVEVSVQSSSPNGDLVVRNPNVEVGGSSLSPGSGPGRDTFSALDGANFAAAPAWIHAGAQRAEAGFQDPALGWVGVRADGSAGGVHAAVLPSSTDAAQTLGGHMAGLNDYLAERPLHVANLTLESPENRTAESGQGGNQSMQQEAGQGSGQSSGAGLRASTDLDTPIEIAQSAGNNGAERATELSTPPGGIHISVMA